jgi:hypothetical protein
VAAVLSELGSAPAQTETRRARVCCIGGGSPSLLQGNVPLSVTPAGECAALRHSWRGTGGSPSLLQGNVPLSVTPGGERAALRHSWRGTAGSPSLLERNSRLSVTPGEERPAFRHSWRGTGGSSSLLEGGVSSARGVRTELEICVQKHADSSAAGTGRYSNAPSLRVHDGVSSPGRD